MGCTSWPPLAGADEIGADPNDDGAEGPVPRAEAESKLSLSALPADVPDCASSSGGASLDVGAEAFRFTDGAAILPISRTGRWVASVAAAVCVDVIGAEEAGVEAAAEDAVGDLVPPG